ncbi:hypothetical protein BC830DRAFT_1085935 [Chytriomyces sp. MP71]|nr:hypothetical protein BC830DRAFT_1085935 [Chytriomyces sp. MP71]
MQSRRRMIFQIGAVTGTCPRGSLLEGGSAPTGLACEGKRRCGSNQASVSCQSNLVVFRRVMDRNEIFIAFVQDTRDKEHQLLQKQATKNMLTFPVTAALVASLVQMASAQFCNKSPNSCQVQSDPIVNTFGSTTYEFHGAGLTYALKSNDMNVQVNVAPATRNGQQVLIVDKVIYTCGSQTQTFTLDTITSAMTKLSCDQGSCAGTACTLSVIKGLDPVPNVSIQEIRYMGSTGQGGVCYGTDPSCPPASNGPVPAGNNDGCAPGTYCPVVPANTPAASKTPVPAPSQVYSVPPAPIVPTTTPVPALYTPPAPQKCVPPAGNTPIKTPVATPAVTYAASVAPPAPIKAASQSGIYAAGASRGSWAVALVVGAIVLA